MLYTRSVDHWWSVKVLHVVTLKFASLVVKHCATVNDPVTYSTMTCHCYQLPASQRNSTEKGESQENLKKGKRKGLPG